MRMAGSDEITEKHRGKGNARKAEHMTGSSEPQAAAARLRLVATDVDWSVGGGDDMVEGPVQSLLLLLSGRSAALPDLSGVGTATLASRLP